MIRAPRDQRSFDSSPGLIAVFHALRRLLAPRHPPHALSSLAAWIPSPGPRLGTAGQRTLGLLPGPVPLKTRPRVTILFSLRLMQRFTHQLREHAAGTKPDAASSLLGCNSYRCRIVKEHWAFPPSRPRGPPKSGNVIIGRSFRVVKGIFTIFSRTPPSLFLGDSGEKCASGKETQQTRPRFAPRFR